MRCSGSIPYGYKREKYDKQQLIIDEPAAEIVRKIFHLSIASWRLTVRNADRKPVNMRKSMG
jgi:hypothetical protein